MGKLARELQCKDRRVLLLISSCVSKTCVLEKERERMNCMYIGSCAQRHVPHARVRRPSLQPPLQQGDREGRAWLRCAAHLHALLLQRARARRFRSCSLACAVGRLKCSECSGRAVRAAGLGRGRGLVLGGAGGAGGGGAEGGGALPSLLHAEESFNDI